jgi:hypothetical protein
LKSLLLLLLLVAVVLGVAALLRRRGALPGGRDGPWPFHAKKPMSVPEQVLYHRLVKALPEHIVLAQVQVSRVLGVNRGFRFHEWNNRINRLSYDFLVCAVDASPLAAIELDDRSHETSARAETDLKKEKATSAAGLPLIRWHVKSLPGHDAIRAAFASQAAVPAARRGARPQHPDGDGS